MKRTDTHTIEELGRFFRKLTAVYKRPTPPLPAELQKRLGEVSRVLQTEVPDIRPRDSRRMPGGLLTLPHIPTVVVPDLHARMSFFLSVLRHRPRDERSLLELIDSGEYQIVCVGDGFHSEARGASRWFSAFGEYRGGFRLHAAMDGEMREGLGLMEMVMLTKCRFPERFHFLKGNHENVANEYGAGNYPFGKFVSEGEMVATYMAQAYGESLLSAYAAFEKLLPLLAVGPGILISHAEPARLFTRDEVINHRTNEDVIYGLTWTDNDAAQPGSVQAMLEHYLPADEAAKGRYLGGHRPVPDAYRLRAGGRYVQIHNPNRFNIAIADREPFEPERDIFEIPAWRVEV